MPSGVPMERYSTCSVCGNVFIRKSNKQTRCPTCAAFAKLKKNARSLDGSWTQCPYCGRVTHSQSGFCYLCESSALRQGQIHV